MGCIYLFVNDQCLNFIIVIHIFSVLFLHNFKIKARINVVANITGKSMSIKTNFMDCYCQNLRCCWDFGDLCSSLFSPVIIWKSIDSLELSPCFVDQMRLRKHIIEANIYHFIKCVV